MVRKSTSAVWSTGHSAIHGLVTWSRGPLHLWNVCTLPCEWVAPLDGQASWVNCVRTLWPDGPGVGFIPLVGCCLGGGSSFNGLSTSWVSMEMNGWRGLARHHWLWSLLQLPVHWFVLANGQSSCVGSQAPHGSDRRFLRDESQSSHGVWGNLDLLHFFLHCRGVGVGKGWDRYRLGHPAVEVLAQAPPLNVQSCCDGTTPLKGGSEGIRWFLQPEQHHRNPSCGTLRRPHWT